MDVLRGFIREVLEEARRSDKEGVKSKKTSADELKRWVSPQNFIHFSDLNKLGINPKSEYKTPLGVFGYPLTDENYKQFVANTLPFAAERKYIHVFTAKDPSKVLNISSLTEQEAFSWAKKIATWRGNDDLTFEQFEEATDDCKVNTPGGRLWTFSWHIQDGPLNWNVIFRDIGLDGIVDFGAGIIHQSEPEQAVFFSGAVIEQLAMIENDTAESVALEQDGYGWQGQIKLASNPGTPVKQLRKLLNHSMMGVRAALARNPSTPVDVLEKLARAPEDTVVFCVLHNPSTPKELKEKLSKLPLANVVDPYGALKVWAGT